MFKQGCVHRLMHFAVRESHICYSFSCNINNTGKPFNLKALSLHASCDSTEVAIWKFKWHTQKVQIIL